MGYCVHSTFPVDFCDSNIHVFAYVIVLLFRVLDEYRGKSKKEVKKDSKKFMTKSSRKAKQES